MISGKYKKGFINLLRKMQKGNIEDVGKDCPDCGSKLHIGQHKFEDGMYFVEYCKSCGYRLEKPLNDNKK